MRESKINVVSPVWFLLMSYGFALPALPVMARVPSMDNGDKEH